MINCNIKVEDKGFSTFIPHNLFEKKLKKISLLHYGIGVFDIPIEQLSKYKRGDRFFFDFEKDGCIQLKFVNEENKTEVSEVLLITKNSEIEFLNEISKKSLITQPNLPLTKGNRVYSDWIVCLSAKEIDINKFDYHALRMNLNEKKCYVFTQYTFEYKTKSYVSGYYYNEKSEFKCNFKDETDSNGLKLINDLTGRFSYLNIEDGLNIGNDYFGFEKIFYATFDDLILISNRLHCLLEAANKLNLKFDPDFEYIRALLSSNIWLFSQQSFSMHTCLKNVKLLPIHKRLHIDKYGQFLILDKEIASVFRSNPQLPSFRQAVSDIKDCCCNLINSNNNILKIVDLTAGLDSRMVLANLPINQASLKNKFLLRTLKGGDDWEFSKRIAKFFDLKFISSATYFTLNPRDIYDKKRSWLMGAYYKFNPIKNEFKQIVDIGTFYFQFTGGAGEAMSRPHVRHFIGNNQAIEINSLDKKDQGDALIKALSSQFPGVITDDLSSLTNIISDEIKLSPCPNFLSTIEYFYLSYRTPFHFNTFYSNFGEISLMPIASKHLHAYFYRNSKSFDDFNLGLDVINESNSLLNCFGFNNSDYNSYLETKYPQISRARISFKVDDDDVTYERFSYKKENFKVNDSQYSIAEDNFVLNLVRLASSYSALYKTALNIYTWYKNCKVISKPSLIYMASRVQSVLDQLQYCSK